MPGTWLLIVLRHLWIGWPSSIGLTAMETARLTTVNALMYVFSHLRCFQFHVAYFVYNNWYKVVQLLEHL
jgi:hypothetical protein